MKKLLSSILITIAILPSCTTDKTEVAPKSMVTPAGIDIQRAVDGMNSLSFFNLEAILLKPVDNDPATHLTTIFYADVNGKLAPIIENFEVKDIQATPNGVYVLTNYKMNGNESIAFFVKPNFEWIYLEDVRSESDFKGVTDNGHLVFYNGAILNTTTLQFDRSRVMKDRYITAVSGNFAITTQYSRGQNTSRKIVNLETNVGYEIGFNRAGLNQDITSFKGTDYVMFTSPYAINPLQHFFMDMKTGSISNLYSALFSFTEILRLDDGSAVGFHGHGGLVLGQLSVKKDINGKMEPDNFSVSSVAVTPHSKLPNLKGSLFGSAKYFIVKEANQVKVFDKSLIFKGDILNGLSNATLALVDAQVYYSGTKDGLSVSGVYNLDANQNTILSKEHVFTTIQLL